MKLRRSLAWFGAGVLLVAVFMAYLRPDLVVTLANQIWNCF
jgi:hypothetical protein